MTAVPPLEPERPDDDQQGLRIVGERVPPASVVNDWIVMVAAVVAGAGAVTFALGYLLRQPLEVYGSALAIALLSLGVAVRRLVVDRYPDVEAIEPRPTVSDVQEPAVAGVKPLPRRRLLGRLLAGAAGLLGLSMLAPVAALGPAPREELLHDTPWARGVRLVTTGGRPVRPEDLEPGSVLTVWPENAVEFELASVMLLRLRAEAPLEPTRMDWVVDGDIVAYSKVCTHAGCPVGLFRERDDALFCPCHQSTFDARRGAIPTFGPAARALPQLPLGVEAGFLVSLGDFEDQIGPAIG